MRAAAARGKAMPDHKKMQFARLEPALRLAARGVAEDDTKAIPLPIKLATRSLLRSGPFQPLPAARRPGSATPAAAARRR